MVVVVVVVVVVLGVVVVVVEAAFASMSLTILVSRGPVNGRGVLLGCKVRLLLLLLCTSK